MISEGQFVFMRAKINKIKNWQASIIIALLGFAVYFDGLKNPFMGDDLPQIVNNPVVHSLSHIRLLFESGTFYNGGGIAPLTGTFYRPLETTVFSLIYTMFGAHPFYFHLFQLLLCIGGTIILYLVFRYSFKPLLSLFLSLIFLVHPINSQMIFNIANTQDDLFFFFGILAIWLLLRFKSVRSLVLVAVCLLLSLLSKETGALFVAVALVYLFWWDRKRLYAFIGIMALPIVLYVALRVNAIGLLPKSRIAPIDNLSLMGRMFTAPAIGLFFITNLIFPQKIPYGYYWVYPHFSVQHVLVPLIVDLAAIALVVYGAVNIHKRFDKAMFYTYLFFAIWTALGIFLTLQIIPLDMTATDFWYYFPIAGVLGMLGVVLTVYPIRIPTRWLMAIGIFLIVILGLHTAMSGRNYQSENIFSKYEIQASPDDYTALTNIAYVSYSQGKYREASDDAQRSADIYPTADAYDYLGLALDAQSKYAGAEQAFTDGLKYGDFISLYDNLGAMIVAFGGSEATDQNFLLNSLKQFPQDSNLWTDLAIFEVEHGSNANAKIAMTQAAKYGQVNQTIYEGIMDNKPGIVRLPGLGKSIEFR